MSTPIEIQTYASVRELGEAEYRALVRPETPPFLRFEWLDALERTGCVAPERGWLPMHLGLRVGGELVAAAPAYAKGNSEGEFVFDHAWARFAQGEVGVRYYPKLVVAVPFTPATGPRLLVKAGAPEAALFDAFTVGLARICEEAKLSGAHVLFPSEEQSRALAERGLLERHGVQYHWHNAGYATFDEFLARFDAKRRHQIRRERRELGQRGVRLEVLTGSDLRVSDADFVFDFYAATVDKFPWGRRYLNREFFEEVLATMPEALHVVVGVDEKSKRRLGGAFNLLGADALYGRYWGALAEVPFLHFNVCFYQGIEEAIRRGLSRFEPGAGGEHKRARGFEPTVTRSAHHLVDRRLQAAIADYLRREVRAVDDEVEEADPVLRRLPIA
ncbi:MAG TPA: GNAT family N-acetyltransferase [Polyangiaceae bacterium]